MADVPRFRNVFRFMLPSWLTEDEGERVLWGLGAGKDAYMERVRQGTYARFPTEGTPTALPYHARDRKIVRGIAESDASFGARLIRWLDEHRVRGNPYALMRQLRDYCQADVRVRTVDQRGNWFTIERDGSLEAVIDTGNWDWDSTSPLLFGRFWVIIYPSAGLPWQQAPVWGDPGTWDDDPTATIGTTATLNQVADVRRIVREWKPAGTSCKWIVIAFDDASFDPTAPEPDGTWGNWGVLEDDGDYVPSRLSTARYWAGKAAA